MQLNGNKQFIPIDSNVNSLKHSRIPAVEMSIILKNLDSEFNDIIWLRKHKVVINPRILTLNGTTIIYNKSSLNNTKSEH